ncbi:septum formation inhibitor Maf [Alicyclobacillus cycloheptanicus]|uniref:dTTP/UTP pyrophosphatase n=1 Tax=Alicyclobacillus cycloheptanicus TaxID=1457 RepID=A0ABT9XHF1_9BACL|nr:Maf family protein [Alicyclobacillus cycloheptanicus]MDQ0189617.1 septum formation protein [Alicyclobacillus cycloheptanicus]WDL99926.1 septum formation inhibitor Maf [Alicyclobacillus cycloheptanicus]
MQTKSAATHPQPALVLASGSPRRSELLRTLGLTFTVVPSQADESISHNQPPGAIVEALAERKARTVVPALQDQADAANRVLVIGADTIVVVDGEILGKPADRDHAAHMLQRLQGRTHDVYTGLCIAALPAGTFQTAHSRTTVTMRPLTPVQIDRYIATGEPMDKAGAYAIQGFGATLVRQIEGDYFTVVGLPLALLSDMLAAHDVLVY